MLVGKVQEDFLILGLALGAEKVPREEHSSSIGLLQRGVPEVVDASLEPIEIRLKERRLSMRHKDRAGLHGEREVVDLEGDFLANAYDLNGRHEGIIPVGRFAPEGDGRFVEHKGLRWHNQEYEQTDDRDRGPGFLLP